MSLTLKQKLEILSDAAKYDASCASSGTIKRHSLGHNGLGSTEGSGICHAYAPDGRCISLLKILMTNFCIYDCVYCVNRVSSNVRRARFSVEEIISLTLEFYRRNYIEGLFLSSGIIRSPDKTMEDMVSVVRELRIKYHFNGYIHLKTIPNASSLLVEEAGLYADRLSINIEFPTDSGVQNFAPEKDPAEIRQAMGKLRLGIEAAQEKTLRSKKQKKFAPAGQSTQLIIGADKTNDEDILANSSRLYSSYHLKRVYYSAFSPIPDSSKKLPLVKPPLMREHRLYQADWLLRFYGYSAEEITGPSINGMLDLEIDPKLAWALTNRGKFPVDVNEADKEMLLRIPGLGLKSVNSILSIRRHRRLRFDDLVRLCVSAKKIKPFVKTDDWSPRRLTDLENLRERFIAKPKQLELLP